MNNLKDDLHETFDEERFSSADLLSRIMAKLDLQPGATSHQWTPIVAIMVAVSLVATLLGVRALNLVAVTPSSPLHQCVSTTEVTPANQTRGPLASFTQYPVPTNLAGLARVSPGPDNSLWSIGDDGKGTSFLVKVTTSGTFVEYAVPNAFTKVNALAEGPDGNVWFTEGQGLPVAGAPVATTARQTNVGKIAKMSPSGAVTEYTIATSLIDPSDLTTGPDCNLWILDRAANKVVKLTTSGIVSAYSIPTPNSGPGRITAGPDGSLWLTEYLAGKVARVTTSGIVTEFTLPPDSRSHELRWLPIGITAGSDGNLWVTAAPSCCAGGGPGEVIRITPSGAFTTYAIPSAKTVPGERLLRDPPPQEIVLGSDGNLWLDALNNLDRVTTSGVFTQYTISATGGVLDLSGLATGPDGNIWFTASCLCTPEKSIVGQFVVPPASA